MTFLLMGLATAFNFVVIIKKYQLKRYCDFMLDLSIMTVICLLFSGTFSALAVGMIASMAVSIYLYFRPFTFRQLIPDISLPKGEDDDDDDWEDD